MAYNRSNTARQTANDDADWAARGFINLYLPVTGGDDGKLGAIPLRISREQELALAKAFEADPEGTSKKFLSRLKVVYRSAEPKAKAGFDLG